MFSNGTNLARLLRPALMLSVVLAIPQISYGQELTGLSGGLKILCVHGATGNIYTINTSDECNPSGGTQEFPTGLTVGNAAFDDDLNTTNFNGSTVQFNSVNTAFGGGSATFNNTVSFTGPSVTFSTGTTFSNPATFNGAADFNAAISTSGIDNSGLIDTQNLNVDNSFTATDATMTNVLVNNIFQVANGTSVIMGGNRVTGVAAGVANTDAVNVGQLNAATSGITADVTALETTTATHTSQITTLQTDVTAIENVNSTQTTQITNLQTGLADTTSDVTDLQTDLATETAARVAADNALDTRVDALETITANLDERFDDVQDRSDAGTATAVALSGAMFLPGKTFNLTGNVGAYRGAVAGAMQFGAVVGDRMAINAGIAKGLNKGGKTAVRAGFTLGW